MLPLCGALQITVNDLLSGEKVSELDYRAKAEENMMELMKENAQNKRRIALSAACGAVTVTAVCSLVVNASYLPLPVGVRIALLALAVAVAVWGLERPPCWMRRRGIMNARTARRFSFRQWLHTSKDTTPLRGGG